MIPYGRDYADPYDEVPSLAAVASANGDQPRGMDEDTDSWQPIDLGPYLRGEVKRPEPTVGMARSDGQRVLYPGKEHAVYGETECGKSWWMLMHALAEMDRGNHVVYVHFEECDPSDTIERLQLLGADTSQLLGTFHFVGPERAGRPDQIARLVELGPTLALLDGVNEGMALYRLAINEAEGAADFRRKVMKPFTAAGVTTLSADHVVKSAEHRGRYQFGSVHKANASSGSSFLLETAEPFGRGMRGRSHMYVTKDRPGHLRKHGRPTRLPGVYHVGELVVDDTQTWSPNLTWHVYAPKDGAEPQGEQDPKDDVDEKVLQAVQALATKGRDVVTRTVRAHVDLRACDVDGALERLVVAGRLVETPGKRGARIFSLPTVSQDQHGDRVP